MQIFRPTQVAGIALGLLAFLYPVPVHSAELRVVIDNLRNTRGAVWVALFNGATGFDSDTRYAGAFKSAGTGRIVVAFPELAMGTYAVSAFHDENGNGKLDTNFLGVPSEGYGFSNGAKGTLGPPSFDAASLTVTGDRQSVTLKLSY